MSSHSDARQLELLVRGKLDGQEAAQVRSHLESCATCRAEYQECLAGNQVAEELKQAVEGRPTAVLDHDVDLSSSPPPDSFTGYTILREVSRSGQGVIYQAIQKATRKKVAIKVMREGPFAGPRDRARFEREVQILGALNHPNIVPIHDSGVAAGSHYFVMDYISGQPLDVWMASAERSIEEVLRLFAEICEAVNAAHVRGVIHRDIKPKNILIDAEGRPHVLDFGLAKMATGDVSNGSQPQVMTVTGQFVGSLPWASPEQAEGAPAKIDMRTDVYSLGVVLYQMLTGRFPYEAVGPMREVLDRIITSEPIRPRTIRRQIDDEVETIVLKCLNKDRDRRYQTAGELGRDIRHYLAGEPIEAKRDSGLYVLRKTLRRYKVPAAVVGGFLVLLAAGLASTSYLYVQAEGNREEALAERNRARDAEKLASDRELNARQHLYRSRLNEARQAYESGNLPLARSLLMQSIPGVLSPGADLRGLEWYYAWRLCHPERRVLYGHADAVQDLAFSPDGTTLASASADGTVRLWDPSSGETRRVLWDHMWADVVAFSPKGEWLATAGADCDVQLWDATGRSKSGSPLRGHTRRVNDLAFSSDGRLLASAGDDSTVRLWDPARHQLVATLRAHSHRVFEVSFSPDGQVLASAGEDRCIYLWPVPNLGSGSPAHLDGIGSGYTVNHALCVTFSPDGRWLATGWDTGFVLFYDLRQKTWVRNAGDQEVKHERAVFSVAFSPDGRTLATAGQDGEITFWTFTPHPSLRIRPLWRLRGHSGDVGALVFHPSGNLVASAASDSCVRLWDNWLDGGAGKEHAATTGYQDNHSASSLAMSPDGQFIITGGWQSRVEVFDAQSLRLIRAIECGEPDLKNNGPQNLVLSADGGTLLLWDRSYVGTWETRTWVQHASDRPAHTLASACISPDGSLAVLGLDNGTVEFRDTRTLHVLRTASLAPVPVIAMSFSPTGEWLAISYSVGKGIVQLWRLSEGAYRRTEISLQAAGVIDRIAFSPDGRRLAAAVGTASVRVWTCGTWDNVADFASSRPAFAFTPDSRLLATVADKTKTTLRFWNLEARAEQGVFGGDWGEVYTMAFGPRDAGTLVVGQWGGISVYHAAPEEQAQVSPERALASVASSGETLGKEDRNEAVPALEEAVTLCRRSLGERSIWTARALLNRARVYARSQQQADCLRAEELLKEAATICASQLPPWHNWQLEAVESLRSLYGAGMLDLPSKRSEMEGRASSPAVAAALGTRALAMWPARDERLDAIALLQKAVRISPNDNRLRYRLATALSEVGEHAEALSEFAKVMRADSTAALGGGFASVEVLAGSCLALKQEFGSVPPDAVDAMRKLYDKWASDKRIGAVRVEIAKERHGVVHAEARVARAVARGWKASWSPDGRHLVITKPRAAGLAVIDLDSGAARDIPNLGQGVAKTPAWSPDGRLIAFTKEPAWNRGPEEVWIITPEGKDPRRLSLGCAPEWSADGRLVFLKNKSMLQIVAIPVDPPRARPAWTLSYEGWSRNCSVSPDASMVVVTEGNRIQVVDRRTRRMMACWDTTTEPAGLPSWSPDGRLIALGERFDLNNQFGLWILEPSTGKAAQIADSPCTMAAWSPDGAKLAFDVRGPNPDEWEVRVMETTAAAQLQAVEEGSWLTLCAVDRQRFGEVNPYLTTTPATGPEDRDHAKHKP